VQRGEGTWKRLIKKNFNDNNYIFSLPINGAQSEIIYRSHLSMLYIKRYYVLIKVGVFSFKKLRCLCSWGVDGQW
jgi:hypothetical protein